MKTVVISLGGSIVVPDSIDTEFLVEFRKLIEELTGKGYKFIIICGGGSIARKYQDALSKIIGDDSEAMDWMGISTTHLNAFLIRAVLWELSDENIIQDPNKKIDFTKKVLVAGGWKPGWSTDYDAVLLAKNYNADKIVNMTSIGYVYDKDPKNKGAKPITELSWQELRKIVGNKWLPGLNMPFDPIAAKEAEKLKLSVLITGKDINNLKKAIEGEIFKGTVIK